MEGEERIDHCAGKCKEDAWCLQYCTSDNRRRLAKDDPRKLLVESLDDILDQLKAKAEQEALEFEDAAKKVAELEKEMKVLEAESDEAEEIEHEKQKAAKEAQKKVDDFEDEVCKDIESGINEFLKDREKYFKKEKDKNCTEALEGAKLSREPNSRCISAF